MSLEDMVKSLASSTMHFQQETKTSIKNLETQVSQLANKVGKLKAQGSGKLPSQAINPRENASAVTLRSGKILEETPRKMKDQVEESTQEKNLACEKDEAKTPTSGSKVDSKSPIPTYVPSPPFPSRFAKSKRDEHEKENLETFRKVQVNIPLLDAISTKMFEKAMLDLEASINVMLYSIYASLFLGSLKETSGVLEDVLVQVNQLIFPADFHVLDMQDESTSMTSSLLLGRPFMRDVRTKIDVHDDTLTKEFDDIMDSFVQKNFNLSNEDALDTTLIKSIDVDNLTELSKNLHLCEDIVKIVASLESLPSIPPRYNISYITLPISKEKLLPSVMQAPTLELKHFPEHL
ncbi:uncharacterized protein LOC111390468, partial [Olea europaea var. sylvestris]|uniref:uncharacterized protein LOC111390468 n=1 Tax=Olea europaea var. sylvestris TaxID=158386 RepID=UPI000C1D16B3